MTRRAPVVSPRIWSEMPHDAASIACAALSDSVMNPPVWSETPPMTRRALRVRPCHSAAKLVACMCCSGSVTAGP